MFSFLVRICELFDNFQFEDTTCLCLSSKLNQLLIIITVELTVLLFLELLVDVCDNYPKLN